MTVVLASKFTRKDYLKSLGLLILFSFSMEFFLSPGLKTTVEKQSARMAEFKEPDEIHKMYRERPERVVPMDQRKPDNEIRYAAFGSSDTWGEGIVENREKTYIWQLSKQHGDNYGIRKHGPNYPASCVNTMIGDMVYDVIILEYFIQQETGLMTLARRLRQRFPDAIIIILRQWHPFMLFSPTFEVNIDTWREDHGFSRDFIKNPKFHKKFIRSDPKNWEFRYINWLSKVQYQEDVAKEIGAYVSKMPFTEEAEGPNGYLEIARNFMADDSLHLSEEGHANIAKRIKSIVDRVGVRQKTRVFKFIEEDHCYNWLRTGKIGYGLSHSDTFQMTKIPHTENFALELNDEADDGWISVINSSNHGMKLFIAYMTTFPAPFKYPRVEANVQGKEKHIVLEPESLSHADSTDHAPRLIDLGIIEPGETKVNFRTLEKAERPFRLSQVIVTVDSNGYESLDGDLWIE